MEVLLECELGFAPVWFDGEYEGVGTDNTGGIVSTLVLRVILIGITVVSVDVWTDCCWRLSLENPHVEGE